MAKVKVSEWSSTPASNTDIDGINLAEGMLPSDVNNAMREMMSQLKDLQSANPTYYTSDADALALGAGGTGSITAAGARTNLGITGTGADTTYAYRANNLSDLANATTARSNLSAAKSGANSDITSLTGLTTALTVGQGGTGATSLAGAGIAQVGVAQTFTTPQRGTVTTDNDLSFDLSVTNNFVCTPTGTGTLTFTNHTAGQSGYVLLINTGGYAISAAATTKVGSSFLTTISTAGTYLISYLDNGTNAYCTSSGALA
jgi:hypothetical protein